MMEVRSVNGLQVPVNEVLGLTSPKEGDQAEYSNVKALKFAGVLAILAFSFWVGMRPHWDYPYPLHIDEWFALGFAQSTFETGRLEYPNPYGSGNVSYHQEMGFHLVLGFLQTATGLSWLDLYRMAPGVLLALLAFLVYALGHRGGFGWAAALFALLIPTSIRTLGPAFLVPVATAMLLIPVTLLVLHNLEDQNRGKFLWLLLLLLGGTIFVHPPTEVVVTALAVIYLTGFVAGALAQKHYAQGLSLVVAIGVRLLIPAVVLGLWVPSVSQQVAREAASPDAGPVWLLGFHFQFLPAFGTLAVVLSVIGVFLFMVKGEGIRSYMLPLFTLLLVAYLGVFFPRYRLGPDIIYERGWLYLGLLIAIFAGYALAVYMRSAPAVAAVAKRWLPGVPKGWLTAALLGAGGAVLVLALVTGLLVNEKREAYSQYYRVISDPIFSDFRWLGEHASPGQRVALGEPTIGWAFPPVAGSVAEVYQAVAAPWSTKEADRLRAMLELHRADVPWLRGQGISVFYTCRPVTFACQEMENNDLFKVRAGVYLVPPPSDLR